MSREISTEEALKALEDLMSGVKHPVSYKYSYGELKQYIEQQSELERGLSDEARM